MTHHAFTSPSHNNNLPSPPGDKATSEKANIAPSFPLGHRSRNLSLTLLATSWLTSLTLIALGSAYPANTEPENIGFRTFHASPALKEVLPLLVNIGITILTEGTGYIHAVALRWALGPRLTFNSNLRLFTRVPGSWAFGHLSNFLGAGFLVLSYAATSLIFATLPTPKVCRDLPVIGGGYDCDSRRGVAYFRPGSVLALGVGLAGHNALTTWQLFCGGGRGWGGGIVTWSSSPVTTAWAIAVTGRRERVPGRCMRAVHDAGEPSVPVRPAATGKQRNAWQAHDEVKRVVLFIWTLVVLTFAWFIGVVVAQDALRRQCDPLGDGADIIDSCTNYYVGKNWSLLPDTGGVTGLVKITLMNDGGGQSQGPVLGYAGAFAVVFVMIMGFQSVLTMGLHCAELIVTTSRDEDLWRRAAGPNGITEVGALRIVLRSWKSIVLLVLKPVIHWLFGLAMTFYIGWGVLMRPPQILYLCISVLVIAVFTTYLCVWGPKGPQPATFGHVQTLLDLADEWSEHLFWGQKGESVGDVWHAGTSDERLEPVRLDRVYAGSKLSEAMYCVST